MSKNFLFTSESVSEGHPDKIADKISDVVLDAILEQDKKARVACEVYVKTGFVLIGGEISTTAWIDIEDLVRKTINDIGYTHSEIGFDGNSCAILNVIGRQSQDIATAVDKEETNELGAGDQGLMFGYACNETDVLMPAPITYAHRLVERHAKLRRSQELPFLRPDAKSQVTFRYENSKPVSIDTVVFSTQHDEEVSEKDLYDAVLEEIIKKTLPKKLIHNQTKFHINPGGRFVIGGPMGDCGLTGRKIIVDTYGGMARHGGGAFSGKDPSKVDRSAAYMCRYISKNIIAAGLAEKCEIQISYAIGMEKPTSIFLDTFETNTVPESQIIQAIEKLFDLRPKGIIEKLNLLRPIYKKTSVYGHFGRLESDFTWEKTDKVDELKNYFKS